MNIRQVFRSINNEQTISEFEIGGANPAAPIPVAGDTVHWIVNAKAYKARVHSRLISYGAKEMSLGRDDDFDITVTLTVDIDD